MNVLDPNKSTGPDKIPVKLLKMCALIIAEALSCLFKGKISPFLFLKETLFEIYGIFTVAFIKYKKY